ncbi:MAG: chemotaxis protein CheW [Luteimonas sp.]|nr:chemotaxis protein CheW [Luteimonas sp.]
MSTSSQNAAVQDIRGVLIQIEGARLLLPNATISEVLSYADPERIDNAPDWLLGRIRWRGWQLPLLSFARIAGLAAEQGGLGSKVVVLKALGGDAKLPHFAILTQGFPRLVTVSREKLVADAGDSGPLPHGVQARVLLNEDAALIPDIAAVEASLREALAA